MIISYRFSEVNTGHCRVFIFKNVQGWTEAGPGAETVPESLSSSSPLEALRSELIYSQLSKGWGCCREDSLSVCREENKPE